MRTILVRHSPSSISSSLKVSQTHLYHTKHLTRQLPLNVDQYLCHCEAAIPIQQRPFQADLLTHQWFGKSQSENQEDGGPFNSIYISIYIKQIFYLPSYLSF